MNNRIAYSYIFRKNIIFIVLFGIISFVLTSMNEPLARFAYQDILYNDQILLSRIAWIKDALINSSFASIDFLQGLGSDLRHDVKVVPHFYDPAVLFSLFFSFKASLWLRTFFLNFYCIWSLDLLWRQQYGESKGSALTENLRFPLILFYMISPQLLNEVSNHFSAIFYALPGVLVAIRSILIKSKIKNIIYFVAASTLFVNLSDLHIAFFALTIVLFLLLLDPITRNSGHLTIVVVIMSFGLISILSYISFIGLLSMGSDEITVSKTMTWPLGKYMLDFVFGAIKSLLKPYSSGPYTIYIAPYIPAFILFYYEFRNNKEKIKMLWLLCSLLLGLIILGIPLHGFEFIREKLPSVFRYHVTIIPFLVNIWLIFHADDVAKSVENITSKHTTKKILKIGVLIFVVSFVWSGWAFDPDSPTFIFNSIELRTNVLLWKIIDVLVSHTFPIIFILLLIYGRYFVMNKSKNALLCLLVILTTSAMFYTIRTTRGQVFIDRKLFSALYEEFPDALNEIIENSNYSNFPRSIVTVAKGFKGTKPKRGVNDKLLSYMELPERINSRTFFHWRYSYTTHTGALYAKVTQHGPRNIYPPTPQYLSNAIEFAILTESPFILSADALLEDTRLEYMGTHQIPESLIQNKPGKNQSLAGSVYLYAVIQVIASENQRSFQDVKFSRVDIKFIGVKTDRRIIKLPISYLKNLIVTNESGKPIQVYKTPDGFAYVKNDGTFKDLRVTSFTWLALPPMLAPLIGFVPFMILMGIAAARKIKAGKLQSKV